jgi:putative addiction module CopG family antidote
MNVSLGLDAEKMIDEQVRSGKYSTAEEVVTAALQALAQGGADDFAEGELDALLEEGEAGESLDGEAVFAELRRLGETRRQNGSK